MEAPRCRLDVSMTVSRRRIRWGKEASSRRPKGDNAFSTDARSIFTVSQAYYNIATRAHAMWPSTLNSAKKESVILQVTLNYYLHLKPIFMHAGSVDNPADQSSKAKINHIERLLSRWPMPSPVHIVMSRGSEVMSALCDEEGRDRLGRGKAFQVLQRRSSGKSN